MSEVRKWLEGQGFGQYAGAFEAQEIQTEDLRDLKEADLEKLGLPMGPRKRLLRAIAALEDQPQQQPFSGRPDRVQARTAAARYAPASLAEKILSARASIEGERKQVTILFADVKGSTDLVEHLDAEEVSALLDPLQKLMIDAVHVYEGTVNEVLGDGIMAIFGAPLAHEDHALRACRAALDMQDAIRRWVEQSCARFTRARHPAAGRPEFRRGGGPRDQQRPHHQLFGDGHDHPSGGADGADRRARDHPDLERYASAGGRPGRRPPRGKIKMKGVAKPVPVYQLRGLGKARTRLEAASMAGLTPFVGREQELRVLEERFAEAEAGQGQVVTIVGDPGIGKSRLLMEFRARIGNRAAWVEGRSVSFGRRWPFIR